MSQITIIAAVAENGAIGKNQKLLCHLPNDLKRFKELTTGHTIIMGRKTFESLPNGALPNRKNIILTTMPDADLVNCYTCDSMNKAFELCEKEEEIFIIGGELVYRQALNKADKMYITKIHTEFKDADAFFPVVDWTQWEEVERKNFKADEKHHYDYSFITYIRKG